MQIHIVHFDSENQIKQIRIHWDQASLLRQVEVIGARGRAWPIRDAKDQIRLLKTSVTARSSAAVPAPEPADHTPTTLLIPAQALHQGSLRGRVLDRASLA